MAPDIIEQIAAFSTPVALPDEETGRDVRNWIVRVSDDIPEDWSVDDISATLTQEAVTAVRDAIAARGLATGDQSLAPSVRVRLVDRRHLVLDVRTVRLRDDAAHAYLVAASAALRALHRLATIDDIQGLPMRFWRLLVGP